MKTYKFISEMTIEAENEEDAKEKFADNSIDFTANATVEEVEEKIYDIQGRKLTPERIHKTG